MNNEETKYATGRMSKSEIIEKFNSLSSPGNEEIKNKFRGEGKLEGISIYDKEKTLLSEKLYGAYFTGYYDMDMIFNALDIDACVVSSYLHVSYKNGIAMFEYRVPNLDCHIFIYYDCYYKLYREMVSSEFVIGYYGSEANLRPSNNTFNNVKTSRLFNK